MSNVHGLWKRICKFCGIKSVSDGDTKNYNEGKGNGVSRTITWNEYITKYVNEKRSTLSLWQKFLLWLDGESLSAGLFARIVGIALGVLLFEVAIRPLMQVLLL